MIKHTWHLDICGRSDEVTIVDEGGRHRIVTSKGEASFEITDLGDGTVLVKSDAGTRRIVWARHGDAVFVGAEGRAWTVARRKAEARSDADDADHSGEITAPMTGRVVEVPCAVGDVVTKGDPVVVVEAMKMEHRLQAPFDATVESITCEVDRQVATGEVLARLTRIENNEAETKETEE